MIYAYIYIYIHIYIYLEPLWFQVFCLQHLWHYTPRAKRICSKNRYWFSHGTRVDWMLSSRANSHQPNLCACGHHNWLTGHRLPYPAHGCGTCRDERSGTWKGNARTMTRWTLIQFKQFDSFWSCHAWPWQIFLKNRHILEFMLGCHQVSTRIQDELAFQGG